ncbi:phage baseplate assembly protein [Pseudomonas costantinii]|uniref:Mu-like prophage tail protein gpP n=1 Tax=Pseudomonas costantinii TaxID=168469 RepID=A0A1H5IDK5_9PSED|nr:phage tail protein [Pseudomonas costantinii]SEE38265.1 Mu-like prophage tail protein gpP [Pseudomonas costantinii]
MLTLNDPVPSIRLAIGGLAHDTWDGWSIESDLLTPADAFELELHTKNAIRLPDVIKEGAPCSLTLDGDRVLTGQIDEFEHDISRRGISMRINGRDLAAPLVDCSSPFVSMREASLAQILDQVVKPLGAYKVEIRADQAKTRRRVQIEPGQTAWEALLQVAEANGLWPWVEPDGRLIIGGPDYTTQPVGVLVMREDGVGNNVERLSVRRSIANRYSQITVLGQHGQYANDGLDTKRSHLRSQVQDETLARRGIFRPKVIVDSSSENQDMATTRARKLLADSRLEGFEIRAVVKGHRADNGQVWTPGQRVIVRSEPHGLNDTYFLMSRTLRLARGEGAITELRLREDKMWVLDGNKLKKHKGKSNPDAAFIQMIKGL